MLSATPESGLFNGILGPALNMGPLAPKEIFGGKYHPSILLWKPIPKEFWPWPPKNRLLGPKDNLFPSYIPTPSGNLPLPNKLQFILDQSFCTDQLYRSHRKS